MKDNISLVGAAAGGFMLSIAVAGILRAAPVTSPQAQPSLTSTQVAQLHIKPGHPDEEVNYNLSQMLSAEN
ncbi:hypothetical protein H6F77_09030 [Microcoleus sp. FACHB-831]|uniref:hypothetical protein n=1 Tax=Microcoleus sp. FACHB-831 TaxID=2692827 RepID=UPI00168755C9|nr:hypothetical protein [Microcoleus sp. FACHB-831]MBD1921234.1 hypothetical protein [Microcoleus sp. FACHB-831]